MICFYTRLQLLYDRKSHTVVDTDGAFVLFLSFGFLFNIIEICFCFVINAVLLLVKFLILAFIELLVLVLLLLLTTPQCSPAFDSLSHVYACKHFHLLVFCYACLVFTSCFHMLFLPAFCTHLCPVPSCHFPLFTCLSL